VVGWEEKEEGGEFVGFDEAEDKVWLEKGEREMKKRKGMDPKADLSKARKRAGREKEMEQEKVEEGVKELAVDYKKGGKTGEKEKAEINGISKPVAKKTEKGVPSKKDTKAKSGKRSTK